MLQNNLNSTFAYTLENAVSYCTPLAQFLVNKNNNGNNNYVII